MGAWIEIAQACSIMHRIWSHPTWVRGLKSILTLFVAVFVMVAPHVGAWIEIRDRAGSFDWTAVAPHVGAWIEINRKATGRDRDLVAPHVGAWIEIDKCSLVESFEASHPTWVRGLK